MFYSASQQGYTISIKKSDYLNEHSLVNMHVIKDLPMKYRPYF